MESLSYSRSWNMNPMNTLYDFNQIIINSETDETTKWAELGFPMMRKSFPEFGISPNCLINSNSFFEELESETRVSDSVIESNNQNSSLIDLKLGSEIKNSQSSNKRLIELGDGVRSKRACKSNFAAQRDPVCQVYGCSKDLSSSKDYYKRHKVCELHTKTAKVIVNGIEKRFCQQCSRFHLVGEFDDDKRSCRKRLAGHNERRRKPQFDAFSYKSQRLLQYYHGSRLLELSLGKGKYLDFGKMKLENEENPLFGDGNLHSKLLFHLYGNLDEVSNSTCALSLLSNRSRNNIDSLLISPGSQIARKSVHQNGFSSNWKELTAPDADIFVRQNGIFRNSDSVNSTVDLVQLSSYLQRVEQQRNSAQI